MEIIMHFTAKMTMHKSHVDLFICAPPPLKILAALINVDSLFAHENNACVRYLSLYLNRLYIHHFLAFF